MSRLTYKLEPAQNVAALKRTYRMTEWVHMPSQSPRHPEAGFTLIELLVVVLVIGILAAIAIPVFLGQRKDANDASAKSDVTAVVKQMEECRLEKSSYTECDSEAELDGAPGINWGFGEGQAGAYDAYSSAKGYGAFAISKSKTGNQNRIFAVVKDSSGDVTRMCVNSSLQPIDEGSCKNGTW